MQTSIEITSLVLLPVGYVCDEQLLSLDCCRGRPEVKTSQNIVGKVTCWQVVTQTDVNMLPCQHSL